MKLNEGNMRNISPKKKIIKSPLDAPPSGYPKYSNADRINVIRKQDGGIRIVFGAHHYINLTKEDNKLFCEIGCTHHGVKFESTHGESELEQVIDRLRKDFPENITD